MISVDLFPPQELCASVSTVIFMSSGKRIHSFLSTWSRTLLSKKISQEGVVLPHSRWLSFFLPIFVRIYRDFHKTLQNPYGWRRKVHPAYTYSLSVTKASALNYPLEALPSFHLVIGGQRLWLQVLWGTIKLMAWFRAWNSLVNIPHMSNGQAFLTQVHRQFYLYKSVSS